MSAFVVTPTYNEIDCLPGLVARLCEHLPDVRILVVDDGSPDGTGDLAEELGCDLLRREGKQGLASAYVDGMTRALELGADRVVQMDADLSHDPADVPRLLAVDADVVLGSRYAPGGGTSGWPLHREVLSRLGSIYARAWLGLPYKDLTGGFKAWKAPMLREVLSTPLVSEGYAFQVEMTLRAVRAGAKVEEVPIVFTERAAGVSKMSGKIAIEAALLVPRLRFARRSTPRSAGGA
ncbi:MAG: polyprenol monophosphomannose synthase [Proteobacteria bacterium]|nr:polyprenol monophosphomannose synthase [Pseudomonadota bacterium]